MRILDGTAHRKNLKNSSWIKDTKSRQCIYRIQYELKEVKEEIKKKGDGLSKIRDLNETLVKEVQK
jgi:hypothetical protein